MVIITLPGGEIFFCNWLISRTLPLPIRSIINKGKWRILFLLVFFHFLFWVNAGGQVPLYSEVSHYNSDNGLPQNTITSMQPDKNDFIWMGTQAGLVRFDGNSMRVFKFSDVVSDCGSWVTKIGWLNNRLMAKELDGKYLFEIKDGNRIIPFTTGGAFAKLQTDLMTNNFYLPPRSGSNVVSLYPDSKDSLSLPVTGEGYRRGAGNEIIYFDNNRQFPLGIHNDSDEDLFSINGSIYLFEEKERVKGYAKREKILRISGTLLTLLQNMSKEERQHSKFLQTGSSVFFFFGSKIYLVNEKRKGELNAELLTNSAAMEGKSTILYLPERKTLFIGTDNDGFFIFRKKYFSVITYPTASAALKKQQPYTVSSNNDFFALQPFNDSVLLSYYGMLTTSGRVIPFRDSISLNLSVISKTTQGYIIHQDVKHRNLFIRDSLMHLISTYSCGNWLRGYCNDNDTTYLYFADGMLQKWLFGKKLPFIKLNEQTLPPTSLPCSFLVKLSADSLFITTDQGILLYNIHTRKYRPIGKLEKNIKIESIYKDKKDVIWIGTLGYGWYRYTTRKGLLQLPLDRKGNLSFIAAIAEDERGYMWVTTFKGIFRFLKKDLDALDSPSDPFFYNYFTKEYGFLSDEFNGTCSPSFVKMKDGKFIFPNLIGLVRFDPHQVPLEEPGSPVIFNDMVVDGRKIDFTERIILAPSFNILSFEVAVPFYGNSYNLQPEYRLSGGASNWTALGEDRRINFNRLERGEYTLTVRMLKGFGSREYTYTTINFIVKSFWYQTWWFYLLLLVLINILLVLYYRLKNRSIQRQKQLLETEVAHRTEDLRISEEKVKQNARFKSQITSLVLHDVRSPLFYLNRITGSIYKNSEGEVPESFREQLKELHLSVKEVSEYAQNLFAWVNAQQDDFVMKSSQVKLQVLFEELKGNYHLLAAQNYNTIGYTVDHNLTVITQADLLQIVLRNMVDNAIKYTQNGRIMLSAEQGQSTVRIMVWDTGKGMAQEKINRIMAEHGNQADTRSGMGYRYIKDLLKKMGVRLEIKSEEGIGTAVTIFLTVNTSVDQ
jgi:signal transduction histidine kinase